MPAGSESGATLRRLPWLRIAAWVLAVGVFLKNAWVTEDAFILLRSLQQLFAGHGPVWNPLERVQVYTSPPWYWLLATLRVVIRDDFLLLVIASAACWLTALWVLGRIWRDDRRFLLGVLLLLASSGFYDYTTSGLENPLMFLVVALILRSALQATGDGAERALREVLLGFGLALWVRLDLAPLLLPAVAWLWLRNDPRRSLRRRIGWTALALAPLAAWTLFSLVYYGFPLPNPVYAKLETGLPRRELILQGLRYCEASLRRDSMTLPVIGAAFALAWLRPLPAGPHRPLRNLARALAAGLALDLLYVVTVGGDFMQGRFFSAAYLIAVVVLLEIGNPGGIPWTSWRRRLAWIALAIFLAAYPHTPLNSRFDYVRPELFKGIADERGFYFPELSLLARLRLDPAAEWPDHRYADEGRVLRDSTARVGTEGCVGMYGYCAGIDKTVVDVLALTDPLLARLPATPGEWRPGHYPRLVPEGYPQRRLDGTTPLADPALDQYYGKLEILTRGRPLLARERLRTIVRFNLCAYDDLRRSARP